MENKKRQLENRKAEFMPMFLEYQEKHKDRLWLPTVLNNWLKVPIPFVFDDEEDERTAWRIFFRCEENLLKELIGIFEKKGQNAPEAVTRRIKYLENRKGGRPRIRDEKQNKHYKSLVIKMNEDEYNEFEKCFSRSGLREKKNFVLSCTGSVDEWRAWRKEGQEAFQRIVEFNSLLRSIGNNINQIAKQVNTRGNVTHEDVESLHKMIDEVEDAVDASLDAMDNLIAKRRRKKRKQS